MKKLLFLALVVVFAFGTIPAYGDGFQFENGVPDIVTGKLTADIPVQVSATVNAKLRLELDDDVVGPAAPLDPEAAAPQWTGAVNLTTKSNVPATLSRTTAGVMNPANPNNPALTTTWTTAPVGAERGLDTYIDNYEISVDYDVVPGTYVETVTYTLVED